MSSIIINSIDGTEFDGDGLELIGTDGFNALKGSKLADYIEARGAGDFIDAASGDDLIDGGMGGDLIHAGNGDDSVLGGGGNDIIFAGEGKDVVLGGEGNDAIFGGKGDDYLLGGDGDDSIFGGQGDDTIKGGVGNDLLFGNAGADEFEFTGEDLDPRFITLIGDFQLDKDRIVLKELEEDSQVSFNSGTGHILVNGNAVIALDNIESSEELEMDFNEDGDFEIM